MAQRKQAVPPAELSVLTKPELARWLKVSERTVDRLHPPSLALGDGTRRYLLRDVLSWLQSRENAA